MKTPDLTITEGQLRVYETIQKIRMAWVALWIALGLFSIVLVAFLVALFKVKDADVAKAIMAGIDATLGWALRTVYANLFPSKSA